MVLQPVMTLIHTRGRRTHRSRANHALSAIWAYQTWSWSARYITTYFPPEVLRRDEAPINGSQTNWSSVDGDGSGFKKRSCWFWKCAAREEEEVNLQSYQLNSSPQKKKKKNMLGQKVCNFERLLSTEFVGFICKGTTPKVKQSDFPLTDNRKTFV